MGVLDFFTSPYTAVILFIIFLVGYFIFLDLEGTFFTEGFLHFGPGDSRATTTSFVGIKLDSWKKVVTLYGISFLTGAMSSYYQNVVTSAMLNPLKAGTQLTKYSQTGLYAVSLIDPLILHCLFVLNLLTTITLQFQFILPSIVGSYITDLPFIIGNVR
jgi:hypothetical protein